MNGALRRFMLREFAPKNLHMLPFVWDRRNEREEEAETSSRFYRSFEVSRWWLEKSRSSTNGGDDHCGTSAVKSRRWRKEASLIDERWRWSLRDQRGRKSTLAQGGLAHRIYRSVCLFFLLISKYRWIVSWQNIEWNVNLRRRSDRERFTWSNNPNVNTPGDG